MKVYQTIKILILIASLVFVIQLIRQLRSPQSNSFISSFFSTPKEGSENLSDFSRTNKSTERKNSHNPSTAFKWQKYSWCQTRVSSIEMLQTKIYQKGLRWFLEKGTNKKELNFVSVEKWLAKYCTIKVQLLNSSTQNEQKFTLENIQLNINITFINGNSLSIDQWAGKIFRSKRENIYYQSEDFESAIKDLNNLVGE